MMTALDGTRSVSVAAKHTELIAFMVSVTRGQTEKRYGSVTSPFKELRQFYVFAAALGWALSDDPPNDTSDLRDATGRDGTPNPVKYDIMEGADGFRLLINTLPVVNDEDISCFGDVDGRVDVFADYMYEGMSWLHNRWEAKGGSDNVSYSPASLIHDAIMEFGNAGFSYVKPDSIDQTDFRSRMLDEE
jgi:hypothetical protein